VARDLARRVSDLAMIVLTSPAIALIKYSGHVGDDKYLYTKEDNTMNTIEPQNEPDDSLDAQRDIIRQSLETTPTTSG
jgi:hypothetical protein